MGMKMAIEGLQVVEVFADPGFGLFGADGRRESEQNQDKEQPK
jgi:hypothetical protein